MPVEDVFRPKTVKTVDPRAADEKQDGGAAYWTKKAEEAKARLDYTEYQRAMEQLGHTPEPPFKVTGEFNLGKIDFQEQQRQAREDAKQVQKDASEKTDGLYRENRELEGRLHEERINSLRHNFDARIGQLQETIEKMVNSNQRQQKPLHEEFLEQYGALQQVARQLGGASTNSGQDPNIQLELARLNFTQAREEREFKRQMRNDEKNWQLQVETLRGEREMRQRELDQSAKKDELFASLPQSIGGAIARGLIDRDQGEAPSSGQIGQAPQQTKVYSVNNIAEGKAVELPCPDCQTPVGVGPNSTSARCVNCGAQFRMNRQPVQGEDYQHPPEPPQSYEEDEE